MQNKTEQIKNNASQNLGHLMGRDKCLELTD